MILICDNCEEEFDTDTNDYVMLDKGDECPECDIGNLELIEDDEN